MPVADLPSLPAPGAADALRQKIEETLRWRCHVPDYLESVDLK